MSKTFPWYMLAPVLATLAMQGCTRRGAVRPAGSAGDVGIAPAPASAAVTTEAPTSAYDKVANRADNKRSFDAVAAAIRKEMSPGGRFEFVSGVERHTVDARLVEMQSLFNQFGSVDKMDIGSKVRLFNDQELINGILTRNDNNRQVCDWEMPVGTHFPKVVCATYGEIRRQQQGNLDFLLRGMIAPPNLPLGEQPPGTAH